MPLFGGHLNSKNPAPNDCKNVIDFFSDRILVSLDILHLLHRNSLCVDGSYCKVLIWSFGRLFMDSLCAMETTMNK